MTTPIEKVSIIVSKGSLEGIYPALILANGARMEGIEANVFFTFFGMDAINKARHEHIKVATVGNPGLHLATWLGGFPGMSSLVTAQMSKAMEKLDIPTLAGAIPGVSALVTKKFASEMEKLDIPPIPEFIEMIADSGAKLYACKASVDMFNLERKDFIDQIEGIITVGDFYQMAGGGQIIFT
jgi:peroxiredoxin family protein